MGSLGAMSEQTIFPTLRYRDARAAIEWLERAFGLAPKEVHEDDTGAVVHAELAFRGNLIMIGSEREAGDAKGPGVYVVVEDPDEHHRVAKEAGAEITMELSDQDYGSRDYAAKDPEGNLWYFGTYQPSA
jgi:uncharacterized glyoxalase superfamily protein PhnB